MAPFCQTVPVPARMIRTICAQSVRLKVSSKCLSNANWFEDPSNASIDCRQTGPITIGDIDLSADGETVFREGRSLIFKSLRVTRIFDQDNQVLIYLTHANELSEGSAKMSISTIPLFGAD